MMYVMQQSICEKSMNVCDARHGFRGHRFALRILAHREVELGERGVTALANFPQSLNNAEEQPNVSRPHNSTCRS